MNTQKQKSGFTIVELIVIIAVIATLAAIVIISFGAWRTNVAASQVKSDLLATVSAMNSARNNENGYPSALPSTVKASSGVTLTVAYATKTNFCINGTSSTVSGVSFYVTEAESNQVKSGTCPASVSVPAAPTNLVSTMPSSTTANFTWTAPSGTVSGYLLQCADDSGFIINKKEASSTTANTTLSGFVTDSAYNCRVRASNSAGQGPWSGILQFVSIPAPASLVATAASATQINTSWGAVGSASSYKLDWSTSSTFATITGTVSGLTSTTRSITGLQQGTRYYVRVMAQSGTANGPASTAATAITSINAPLAPVVTASATGTGAANAVTWSWPAVSCPAGTTAQYSTAYYRDDSTGWRAWSAVTTAVSQSQATDYQGYQYMVKARSRCITSVANSNYSADSNSPAYIRSIDTPGVATAFSATTVDGTGNQVLSNGDNSVVSRWVRINWTPPACGLGTVAVRHSSGMFGMTNGSGGYPAYWTDSPTVAVTKSRWLAASFPIGSYNWSYFQMTNPNTTSMTVTDADAQYSDRRRDYHVPGGWSPVNDSTAAHARALVAYGCVNDVTDRRGFYGNYVTSNVITSF